VRKVKINPKVLAASGVETNSGAKLMLLQHICEYTCAEAVFGECRRKIFKMKKSDYLKAARPFEFQSRGSAASFRIYFLPACI